MNKYLLALISLPKMTPTRLRRILAHRTPQEAWKSKSPSEWLSFGLRKDYISLAFSAKKTLDPDTLATQLEKTNAILLHEDDPAFPPQLKEIPANPAWLFRRGECPTPEPNCLTVVGPRKISAYGRQVTENFVSELVQNNFIIISGLALGVDGLAHQTTLRHSGRTIAFLGCGIDQIYPPRHRELAKQILSSGGAIYSEYPPGTPPNREHFPARNRLVCGLSHSVLLPEAGKSSGSLITATLALEQGKEVFAVPGDIFSPTSAGTNQLIKSGQAQAVTTPQEIMEALEVSDLPLFRQSNRLLPTNPTELKIYNLLSPTPTHIDQITLSSSLSTSQVSSCLSLLELKGFASHVGGMHYIKK